MGRKYDKLSETIDADGKTPWQRPVTQGYRIACCDCGLVHTLDFRISEGQIEFRVSRDNRSTAAMRRHKDPTFNLTFLRHALHSLVEVYRVDTKSMRRRFLARLERDLFP